MPKYYYNIIDEAGLKTTGVIFASNKDLARERLQKKHSIVISIIEDKKAHTWFWEKPSLGIEEKMIFTKHMSTMIKVGITVTEALEILISQTQKKRNRKMYENILDMVKSGQTLSKSLKQYDYIFSNIFINMIATGEKSGSLDEIFERLDIQIEKEYELRKKVVSAFIYPAIIMGLTFIITIGIVVFIMPKITKIFSSFKVQLPLITRVLISFSNFLVHKPLISILIAVGVVGFVSTIFKLKFLKSFWHRIFIHLPVFGKLIIFANLANFSRTLNSLLQSGVPVTEALDIIIKMLDNKLYIDAVSLARDKVEQGGKLGESLETFPKLFPPLATKMLYIGEKTGSMEVSTKSLAELYEHNVDSITKNLSVLLEPILLVFMAGLVGGLVLAIILPIYQLPTLLQR